MANRELRAVIEEPREDEEVQGTYIQYAMYNILYINVMYLS